MPGECRTAGRGRNGARHQSKMPGECRTLGLVPAGLVDALLAWCLTGGLAAQRDTGRVQVHMTSGYRPNIAYSLSNGAARRVWRERDEGQAIR
jgi:hypothetical protein